MVLLLHLVVRALKTLGNDKFCITARCWIRSTFNLRFHSALMWLNVEKKFPRPTKLYSFVPFEKTPSLVSLSCLKYWVNKNIVKLLKNHLKKQIVIRKWAGNAFNANCISYDYLFLFCMISLKFAQASCLPCFYSRCHNDI